MNRAQFLLILQQTTTNTIQGKYRPFKFTIKTDQSITCTFKSDNLQITATIVDRHVKFDVNHSNTSTHLSQKQFMANYPSLYQQFKNALKQYDQTIQLEQQQPSKDQLTITINQTDFTFIQIESQQYNDLYQCRFSTQLFNFKAIIRYRQFNSAITKITTANIGQYNPFEQLSASQFQQQYHQLYKQLSKAIILFQEIKAKQ